MKSRTQDLDPGVPHLASEMWDLLVRLQLPLFVALFCFTLPAHAARTVTDETGHTMTVPDHPHRIICLVPSVTDAAFSLGLADDIVAVSDYTKYPEAATHKPSVGSTLTPSIETILSLHPDLILATAAKSGQATIDQLRRLNLPVFVVDTHGLAGILHSISSIGDATNRKPQAAAEAASLQTRIDRVRASVAGKPIVSVFMPIWYDPPITIGRGAFITELIAAAGGRSVTDDLREEWPHVGMETILARAPEALLLVRGGKITPEILAGRPGWSTLPAIRNHRIYYVDRRVDLSSPVAIDALEDLAHEFHP